jgi:predicted DNA binding CopG/RHH family protein
MGDDMDLEQAHEFYKDPANLVPAGPGHRPKRPAAMSGMVPVRFPQEMIVAVKRFATQDGVTVSTWIRRLVAKEIERRQPPATSTAPAEQTTSFQAQGPLPTSSTSATMRPELIAC